ncbi:MAG TPA: homoprotocatechuate degradation operon regulator HpaR [Gammaproteobacteria bacterium]|nr:homoprotocatechuate degradation operon regulator HpaR [Gammaproteobacteria bacterium]
MTELRKFGESLPMLLLKARETAMVRFRPLLQEYGITEQQWRVLRALEDRGPLTATSLSKECAILAPSMTRIIRRLVEFQLVTAERSSSDHREIEVRIAARGSCIVADLGPDMEEQYAAIRDLLHPDEYAALTRTLKRLIAIDT